MHGSLDRTGGWPRRALGATLLITLTAAFPRAPDRVLAERPAQVPAPASAGSARCFVPLALRASGPSSPRQGADPLEPFFSLDRVHRVASNRMYS